MECKSNLSSRRFSFSLFLKKKIILFLRFSLRFDASMRLKIVDATHFSIKNVIFIAFHAKEKKQHSFDFYQFWFAAIEESFWLTKVIKSNIINNYLSIYLYYIHTQVIKWQKNEQTWIPADVADTSADALHIYVFLMTHFALSISILLYIRFAAATCECLWCFFCFFFVSSFIWKFLHVHFDIHLIFISTHRFASPYYEFWCCQCYARR